MNNPTQPFHPGMQMTFTLGPDNKSANVDQIISLTSDNTAVVSVEILTDGATPVAHAVGVGVSSVTATLLVTETDGAQAGTQRTITGTGVVTVTPTPPPPQAPVIPPAASVVFSWGLPVNGTTIEP